MATKQQRNADGEAGPAAKRMKETINEAAAELVCPITSSLPIDPVMAEDGHVYEREAIESWFARGKQTSPVTNSNIGTKLIPSKQVRNLIEHMVRSGTISGDVADKWTQRIKNLDKVKDCRDKAEAGDVAAMKRLALAYRDGDYDLAVDKRLAIQWFRKHVEAMNSLGSDALCATQPLKISKTPTANWFTKMSAAPVRNATTNQRDRAAKALHELPGE